MASPSLPRKNAVMRKGCNGQNIKVFVRCRPMNNLEKNIKSFSSVTCPTNRDIVLKERPLDKLTKTFSFDRAFGSDSKQIDVYKCVAKPLVDEVLNGFNCTIFAYGQTGTGKTFTMEGEKSPNSTAWDEDPLAGIIPRCVNHLFDELRVMKAEFTMRVSFLELYNEELFDLLSPQDDLSKLRLYEDVSRKGSCIIHGLEEVLVRTKADVYAIIEKGSAKRQTAATLMNAHSSRSHTVFTVTVHMKENTIEGDELLKTGKLHLVDLAGSENIGRSGAVEKRAREAGNINQSLLTLGRVITSLVEKAPHVPYRESKLTRLLQDALGGRTKTSIIATVSPSSSNYDETLSTLDYAHRAKNIQNKPEVNQKLNKKELIGEYTEEIERLRRDLMASREKNGVYLARENYEELCSQNEQQMQEISEKINHIRALQDELDKKNEEFDELNMKLEETSEKLVKTEHDLGETKNVLDCTQKLLSETSVERDAQKYLVSAHVKTEDKLLHQGENLLSVAEETTSQLSKLHDKLDRKSTVEQHNVDVRTRIKENFEKSVDVLREDVTSKVTSLKQDFGEISSSLGELQKKRHQEVNSLLKEQTLLGQSQSKMITALSEFCRRQMEEFCQREKMFCENAKSGFEEQIRSIQLFHKDMFLVAIDSVASIIATHGATINKLNKSIINKMAKINEESSSYAVSQQEKLQEFEKKILGTNDDVAVCISNLKTSCSNQRNTMDSYVKDICEKVESIQSILNHMNLNSQEFTATTNTNWNIVTSEVNNCEAKNIEERETVVNCGAMIRKETANQQERLMNSHKEALEEFEESINQLEQDVTLLGQERCTLESEMDRFVAVSTSSISTHSEEVTKHVEETSAIVKDNLTKLDGTAKENIHTLMKIVEDQNAVIEKELTSMEETCQHLQKDIKISVSSTETWFTDHTHSILDHYEAVTDMLSKHMKEDIPTGQTPIRQDFTFPRTLSITSPHDQILKRFHANSAASLSQTPLPEFITDEEDELMDSTSSTESSKIEYSVEERIRSGSVSSRPASRNGSDEYEMFAVPRVLHPLSKSSSTQSLSESKGKVLDRSSSTCSLPEAKCGCMSLTWLPPL
ncbi:uncharacterized protein LOC143040737 isoform X2 [Oratosquilla oratoria]|uniref:uncharacterized protein LOC143040737 isoform X2 n=1 Tax=Oratosquilla oratoria TaxID=337810 RepID=UPI003F76EFC1